MTLQASFNNEGDALVISQQASNQLVSSDVRRNGTLFTSTAMVTTPSLTPFSFRTSRRNGLVV